MSSKTTAVTLCALNVLLGAMLFWACCVGFVAGSPPESSRLAWGSFFTISAGLLIGISIAVCLALKEEAK